MWCFIQSLNNKYYVHETFTLWDICKYVQNGVKLVSFYALNCQFFTGLTVHLKLKIILDNDWNWPGYWEENSKYLCFMSQIKKDWLYMLKILFSITMVFKCTQTLTEMLVFLWFHCLVNPHFNLSKFHFKYLSHLISQVQLIFYPPSYMLLPSYNRRKRELGWWCDNQCVISQHMENRLSLHSTCVTDFYSITSWVTLLY